MSARLHPYPRLQWVDVLRGLALAGMVVYHFSWDLSYFGYIAPASASQGGLRLLARVVAFSFLFLAGFSLFLSHGHGIRWQAFWRRFIIIAACALMISGVTWWLMPENFIYFGILHEIALTSLAGLLFLRVPVVLNLVLAGGIALLPAYCHCLPGPWFWWLGLAANARPSFDYVPFFPWFGAGLLGLTVARILHYGGKLHWLQKAAALQPFSRWLQWAGRHSLLLYVLHQPLLLGALYVGALLFPPSLAHMRAGIEQDCRLACEQQAGPALCEHFCRCSLDTMQQRGLLRPYIQGKINVTAGVLMDIRAYCAHISSAPPQ